MPGRRLHPEPAGGVGEPSGQQPDVEDGGTVALLVIGEQVEEQRAEPGLAEGGRPQAGPGAPATSWLRGLCRLLPLPCTNTTIRAAAGGTLRCPASRAEPAITSTSSSVPTVSVPTVSRVPGVVFAVGAAGVPTVPGMAARRRSATTSSSLVCEKSLYHWPMAMNRSGVSRQTTSSATEESPGIAARGATGTASTTRAAPCARAT